MAETKTIKDRYWTGIIYPDSMAYPIEEWGDIIQKPYCYCVHDKDKDGHKGDRKTHIHLVIVWNNNTTYNSALNLFKKIMPSCSKIEQVQDINYLYEYLIHNTDTCKQANKHLYGVEERVCCNNFDIGLYAKVTLEEKNKYRKELASLIIDRNITNYSDFYFVVLNNFEDVYEEVASNYVNFFSNLCKGNFLRGRHKE